MSYCCLRGAGSSAWGEAISVKVARSRRLPARSSEVTCSTLFPCFTGKEFAQPFRLWLLRQYSRTYLWFYSPADYNLSCSITFPSPPSQPKHRRLEHHQSKHTTTPSTSTHRSNPIMATLQDPVFVPGSNDAFYGPIPKNEQIFDIAFLEISPSPIQLYVLRPKKKVTHC